MGFGPLGFQPNRLETVRERLLPLATPRQQVAEIVMRFGKIGLSLDRVAQHIDRLAEATGPGIQRVEMFP